MNVFLWSVQAILAALFAMSGLVKVLQPKDKLAGKYPWTQDVSGGTVRFIGVMELFGAVGLIVPAATGIAPILTPIAGTGLAVIMVLAAGTHIRRKEPSGVAVTAILFVLVALVAWGRSIRPLQLVTAPRAKYDRRRPLERVPRCRGGGCCRHRGRDSAAEFGYLRKSQDRRGSRRVAVDAESGRELAPGLAVFGRQRHQHPVGPGVGHRCRSSAAETRLRRASRAATAEMVCVRRARQCQSDDPPCSSH
jgi:hypothetical protein